MVWVGRELKAHSPWARTPSTIQASLNPVNFLVGEDGHLVFPRTFLFLIPLRYTQNKGLTITRISLFLLSLLRVQGSVQLHCYFRSRLRGFTPILLQSWGSACPLTASPKKYHPQTHYPFALTSKPALRNHTWGGFQKIKGFFSWVKDSPLERPCVSKVPKFRVPSAAAPSEDTEVMYPQDTGLSFHFNSQTPCKPQGMDKLPLLLLPIPCTCKGFFFLDFVY